MRIMYKEDDNFIVHEVHNVESDGDEHILIHGSIGIRFETGAETTEVLRKLLEQGYMDLSGYEYVEIYENSY